MRILGGSRGCRRALEISFAVVAFQQFSGINAILFFGQSIFSDAGVDMSPAVATIIIGVVLTLASLFGSFLTIFFSSRFLLFVSSAGLVLTNVSSQFLLQQVCYIGGILMYLLFVSFI